MAQLVYCKVDSVASLTLAYNVLGRMLYLLDCKFSHKLPI